eukprot:scaffold164850_cov31-Attheya_sp.AAC.1
MAKLLRHVKVNQQINSSPVLIRLQKHSSPKDDGVASQLMNAGVDCIYDQSSHLIERAIGRKINLLPPLTGVEPSLTMLTT